MRHRVRTALVAAGMAAAASTALVAAPAYATPGDADVDFGGTGTVTVPVSGFGFQDFSDLTTDTSGRILGTGFAFSASADRYLVARVRGDGGLDSSFAASSPAGPGRALIGFGPISTFPGAVAALPDGHVVAAGLAQQQGWGFGLLTSAGSPTSHPTFVQSIGEDNTDEDAGVHDVLAQSDGKIVAAGLTKLNGTFAIGLARFTEDGTPDSSFSFDGQVVQEAPGSSAAADFGLACAQPASAPRTCATGSKLLVGGQAVVGGTTKLVVLRYNADGSLDHTFGGAGNGAAVLGPLTFSGAPSGQIADYGLGHVLSVDSAGRAVIGEGRTIERLTTSGAPDTTFGAGGVVTLGQQDKVMALATTSQSGVVALVSSGTGGEVRRYSSNGQPDANFGPGTGAVPAPPGAASSHALAVTPDAQILVGGHTSQLHATITRLLDDAFSLPPLIVPSSLTATIGVRLVTATGVGILVRQRRHGRVVTIGRVPFGRRHRGRNRIRWNYRVHGRRLRPGVYLIRVRLLTRRGRVFEVSRPFRVRVPAPRRRR